MSITMLNIKTEVEELWDELNRAIQGVLKSTQFIMGPNVKAFEEETAAYLGVRHSIAVNSGTDALVIGLKSTGIQPGDEVITTPFTFYATAEAISLVGATPVFVDVNPETFNIDVRLIEKAITSKTKGIIPVHLYGQAADMDPILALARQYRLKVIEDVAQAFGGEYKGKKLGGIGEAGCFSFYPSKNLGAYGDGGLITTNDDKVAELARMLRVHGAKRAYYNELIGYNSRLDELQAAILRVKLPHVDSWNESRRKVASIYNQLLANTPDVITPVEVPNVRHVYHQYTIRILNGKRDQVKQHLDQAGIASMLYYPVPVHRLPVYEKNAPRLKVAEELAGEVISLPIWPAIERQTQETVAGEIKKALELAL